MARNLALPNNEGFAPPFDPNPLSADEANRIVSDLREQREQRAENGKKARAVQVAMTYRVASLVSKDDPAWLALVTTFQAQMPDVPINPRKRINTLCKFVNGPDDTGAVKLAWSQAHRRAYVLLELAARQIPVDQAYDYLMKVANLQMLADSWKRRRAGKLAAAMPGTAEGTTQGGQRIVFTIDPAVATVLESETAGPRLFDAVHQPSDDGNVNITVIGVRADQPADDVASIEPKAPPIVVPEGWVLVPMMARIEDLPTLFQDFEVNLIAVERIRDEHQRNIVQLIPSTPRDPRSVPGPSGYSPATLEKQKEFSNRRRAVAAALQQRKASAAAQVSGERKVGPGPGGVNRSTPGAAGGLQARPVTPPVRPSMVPSRGPGGTGKTVAKASQPMFRPSFTGRPVTPVAMAPKPGFDPRAVRKPS